MAALVGAGLIVGGCDGGQPSAPVPTPPQSSGAASHKATGQRVSSPGASSDLSGASADGSWTPASSNVQAATAAPPPPPECEGMSLISVLTPRAVSATTSFPLVAPDPAGRYVLTVQPGARAVVFLDGQQVLGPSDFHHGRLTRVELALQPSSVLDVRPLGQGSVEVEVEGVVSDATIPQSAWRHVFETTIYRGSFERGDAAVSVSSPVSVGLFFLHVTSNATSSATVSWNGSALFDPGDFNPQTLSLGAPVLVQPSNDLHVSIAGRATSTIEVEVRGWAVDEAAPSLQWLTPSEGACAGPAQVLSASFSDPSGTHAVQLIVDDVDVTGAAKIGTGTVSVTLDDLPVGARAEGEKTALLRVVDGACNLAESTLHFFYDATPPALTLLPADGAVVVSGSLTVTIAAVDSGCGVDPGSLALLVDGEPAGVSFVGSIATIDLALAPGPHTLIASVSDSAGNATTVTSHVVLAPRGVSGVVLGGTTEGQLAPVAGARIRALDGPPVEAQTDSAGRFALYGPQIGRVRIVADGYLVGHGRSTFVVDVVDGVVTPFERPVIVPVVSNEDGVEVLLDPSGRTTSELIVSTAVLNTASITIAAGSRIVLPDDGFTLPPGQPLRISLHRLAGTLSTNAPPVEGGEELAFRGVFSLQPEGLEVVEGFVTDLPNEVGVAPLSSLTLHAFDVTTGQWRVATELSASADGDRLTGVLHSTLEVWAVAGQTTRVDHVARGELGIFGSEYFYGDLVPIQVNWASVFDARGENEPLQAIQFSGPAGTIHKLDWLRFGTTQDGLFDLQFKVGTPQAYTLHSGHWVGILDRTPGQMDQFYPPDSAFPFATPVYARSSRLTFRGRDTIVPDRAGTEVTAGVYAVVFERRLGDTQDDWPNTPSFPSENRANGVFVPGVYGRHSPIGVTATFDGWAGYGNAHGATYTYRVKLVDAAGNAVFLPSEEGFTVRIDRQRPDVQAANFAQPALRATGGSVDWVASDDSQLYKVELLTGNQVLAVAFATEPNPRGTFQIPFSYGVRTYRIRATDTAGNTSDVPTDPQQPDPESAPFEYRFDDQGPAFGVEHQVNPITVVGQRPRVTLTTPNDPIAGLKDWKIERAPVGGSFVQLQGFTAFGQPNANVDHDDVALADGQYIYRVTARDQETFATSTGNVSVRQSQILVVDTVGPTIAISPSGLVGPGPVQFQVTLTDPSRINQNTVVVTVDGALQSIAFDPIAPGSAVSTARFTIQRLVHDVGHRVEVTAKDMLGLSSTATATVRQDHFPPIVDTFTPGTTTTAHLSASSSVTWSATYHDETSVVDPDTVRLFLSSNGAPQVDVTGQATIQGLGTPSSTGVSVTTTLPQGSSTLTLSIADSTGATTIATRSVLVDSNAPTATIQTSPPPVTQAFCPSRFPPLVLSLSDTGGLGVGARTVRVFLDSVDLTARASVTPVLVRFTPPTPLNDGLHEYRVEASDLAGNTLLPVVVTFKVDATGPSTPALPMVGARQFKPITTLRWTASTDAGAGLAGYVLLRTEDGEHWAEVAAVGPSVLQADVPFPLGEKTAYRVVAIDALGNQSAPGEAEGCEIAGLDQLDRPVSSALVVQLVRGDGSPVDDALVEETTGSAPLTTPLTNQPGTGVYRSAARFWSSGQPLNLRIVSDGVEFVSGPLLPLLPEDVETDFGRITITKNRLRGQVFGTGGRNTPPLGAGGLGATGGEAGAAGPPVLSSGLVSLVAGFWNTVDVEGEPVIDVLQTPPAICTRYVPVYFELVCDLTAVQVRADFSRDAGRTWAPMTLAAASAPLAGPDITTPLFGTPLGRRYVVIWDTERDLEGVSLADCTLRFSPVGFPVERGDSIDTTLIRAFSVVSVAPPSGTLDVEPSAPITLTFTDEVTTDGMNLTASIVADDVGAGAPLGVSIAVSGKTVVVTPSPAFPSSSQVRIRVLPTLEAIEPLAFDQQPLLQGRGAFEAHYRTGGVDVTPPALMSVSPPTGSSGIATSAPVVFTFDEPLDPASIGPNTVTLTSTPGGVVAVTTTLLADQRTLFVQPASPLTPGHCYTAAVAPLLRDATGNALGTTEHTTFATVSPSPGATLAPPVIASPATGTVVSPPPGTPPTVVVTGTAAPNHAVRLFVNGYPTGLVAPVDAAGNFSLETFPLAPGTSRLAASTEDPLGSSSAPSAEVVVEVPSGLQITPPGPGEPQRFEVVNGRGADPSMRQRLTVPGPAGAPLELHVTTAGTKAGAKAAPTIGAGGGTHELYPGEQVLTNLTLDMSGLFTFDVGGFDAAFDGVTIEAIRADTGEVLATQEVASKPGLCVLQAQGAGGSSEETIQASAALRVLTQENDTSKVEAPAGVPLRFVVVDANGKPSDALEINGQPGGTGAVVTTDAAGNTALDLRWIDRTQPVRLLVYRTDVFADGLGLEEVQIGEEILDPLGEDTPSDKPVPTQPTEPFQNPNEGGWTGTYAVGCPPNYPAAPAQVQVTYRTVAKPVLLHNGGEHMSRIDLVVPSPHGPTFVFGRSFKGPTIYERTLGAGWSHGYDQRLIEEPSGAVSWVTAGLRTETFQPLGGGRFASPSERAEILTVSNRVGTIRTPGGMRFVFRSFEAQNARGALERIVEPDGDALTFSYWLTSGGGGRTGEIHTATDATGRLVAEIKYDLRGRVTEVIDRTLPDRAVRFDYGVYGDLVRVRSPVVLTSTEGEPLLPAQQFPNGRVEVYGYTSGYADERLNHQLRFVVAPVEAAAAGLDLLQPERLEDPALLRPLAYCENTYGIDPTQESFGRVIEQRLGGSSTLPAWTGQTTPEECGGTISLRYVELPVPPNASRNHPVAKTVLLDRGGNLKEYFHDASGHLVRLDEYSNRNLRPKATGATPNPGEDLPRYTRTWVYSKDGLAIAVVNPSGSVWRWIYPDEDLNGDGALTPGEDRNGDGDFDDPEDVQPEDDPRYAWKPDNVLDRARPEARWQWVRSETVPDARGDSRGNSPPLSRVWTRTFEPWFQGLTSSVDPRGNDPTYRPQNGPKEGDTPSSMPSPDPARYRTTLFYDYQQGDPTDALEAFAQDLGITDMQVAEQLMSDAGVRLGLTGLNDSTADDGFRHGNVVRTELPSVTLLPSQSDLRAVHGPTLHLSSTAEHNRYGQVVRTRDAERNVHTIAYHPSSNDSATGGYVREVVADDSATDPLRNSGKGGDPVRARVRFFHDDAGNVVRTIDARGVEHRVTYNTLFEVVRTQAATAIVGPTLHEPTAAIEALDYESLVFHDHDGRVVEVRGENAGERDGSANQVATNPFWTGKTAYNVLGDVVLSLAEVEPIGDDDSITVSSPGVIVGRAAYYPNQLPKYSIAPEGNVAAFAWDERDLPFQVTSGFGTPDAGTVTYHHTVNGTPHLTVDAVKHNPSRWTQFAGDVTRTKYDGFDQVLCTTSPEGNCGDSVYDPCGRRVRFVRFATAEPGVPRLAEFESHYDEAGRPFLSEARVFEEGGSYSSATWTRTIPVAGDPAPELESGSLTELDSLGRAIRTVDANGHDSRAVWDGASRMVEAEGPAFAAVDGSNAVRNHVRVSYNQAGQAIEVTTIDKSPITLDPVTHGISSTVTEKSFRSFVALDALGRVVEATDPVGQTSRMVYDSRSLVIAASDAKTSAPNVAPRTGYGSLVNGHGNVVHAYFDGLGRPLRTELLLKTNGVGNGQLDLSGVYTDLDTSNPANADGRITIRQSFDRNSRLVSRSDDNGNATAYVYDQRDRAVGVMGADLTMSRTIYDKDSFPFQTIARNGTILQRTYDADGRTVKVEAIRTATNLEGTGQVVEGTAVQAWEYDGLSRPRVCVDQNDPADLTDDVATSYTYDSLSRQLTERHRFKAQTSINAVNTQYGRITVGPAGIDRTVGRTFDLDSNRLTTMYGYVDGVTPPARTISYAHDGLDRVQRIVEGALPGGTTIQSTEWIGGRPQVQDAGNGVRTSFVYDLKRRLQSLTHVGSGGVGTSVASFNYTWTRSDQRATESFSAAGLPNANQTYTYDSAARLVRVAHAGGAAPRPDTTWLIDGVGNQVKKIEDGETTALNVRPNGRYLADAMNEVARLTRFSATGLFVSEEQHTQDPNGNPLLRGDLKLSWDAFDRLVKVERAGETVGIYKYDASSRRVDRQFRVAGDPGLTQVYHVHDGAQEVEELDLAGTVQSDFVWGNLYIDHLVQLRRQTSPGVYTSYYAHQSSLFSVVALSDSNGNVVERCRYSSVYGVCQVQDAAGGARPAASEIGNPWRFQGRRFDPETGFYSFRLRFLAPGAGRWVNRDPLGVWGDAAQRGNAYSALGNDPVNRVDPRGCTDECDPFVIAGRPLVDRDPDYGLTTYYSRVSAPGENGRPAGSPQSEDRVYAERRRVEVRDRVSGVMLQTQEWSLQRWGSLGTFTIPMPRILRGSLNFSYKPITITRPDAHYWMYRRTDWAAGKPIEQAVTYFGVRTARQQGLPVHQRTINFITGEDIAATIRYGRHRMLGIPYIHRMFEVKGPDSTTSLSLWSTMAPGFETAVGSYSKEVSEARGVTIETTTLYHLTRIAGGLNQYRWLPTGAIAQQDQTVHVWGSELNGFLGSATRTAFLAEDGINPVSVAPETLEWPSLASNIDWTAANLIGGLNPLD